MINTKYILALICGLVFCLLGSAMADDLVVQFKNLKPNKGYVMALLVDGEDNWQRVMGGKSSGDGGVGQRVKVNDSRQLEVVFTGLEASDLANGRYAIIAYQDVDGDGEMKKGLFGIPQEPLGSSNDAPALFGPPKFKDAKIRLRKEQEAIVINMK